MKIKYLAKFTTVYSISALQFAHGVIQKGLNLKTTCLYFFFLDYWLLEPYTFIR